MRVWDIPVDQLCRKHLMAQHLEIHTIYKTIQTGRKGYANHPETKRWVNKEHALKRVHDATADEMVRRGYNHHSPLEPATGMDIPQTDFVHTVEQQIQILHDKGCECVVWAVA